MNAEAVLRQARGAAQRRAFAHAALWLSPWLLAAFVLAWRLRATPWCWLLVAAALAIAGWRLWRASRGFDDRWLARGLDNKRVDMEDSAELLFARSPPTNPLEDLQRARLRLRLESAPAPDLRAPWPTRNLFANAVAASVCIIVFALWPARHAIKPQTIAAVPVPAATPARPAQLIGQHIDIRPPAYTGLPARSVDTLATKVLEGSTLQWTLRFAPMPDRAELVFHDGRRVALQRRGDAWTASRRIDKATLYRVALAHPLPAAQARLQRIDVVTDRPPQLRAVQPQHTLTMLTPGQRSWTLAFEGSDDYGLAATAQLRITRTEGSGENITAKQQTIALRGAGSARSRRYAHNVDLAALGLVAGDD
ncbi:MAG: hypothetical protein H7Y19_00065, partial [Luteimonas sp.]|nr:hypothetical protein [Luteimonas sp.]